MDISLPLIFFSRFFLRARKRLLFEPSRGGRGPRREGILAEKRARIAKKGPETRAYGRAVCSRGGIKRRAGTFRLDN